MNIVSGDDRSLTRPQEGEQEAGRDCTLCSKGIGQGRAGVRQVVLFPRRLKPVCRPGKRNLKSQNLRKKGTGGRTNLA